MFFEYDNDLWSNIQDDLLMGIKREVPGSLIEIISHKTGYEIHYQDTFGQLCEFNITKADVFCQYLTRENLLDILFIFTCFDKGDLKKGKITFDKSAIKIEWNNVKPSINDEKSIKINEQTITTYVGYKDVEERFIKKLENQKKLKLNLIIEEENMGPYVNLSQCATITGNYDSSLCYTSAVTDKKQTIYTHKKVNVKYQSLLKDLLKLDTKFINRFYKYVDNSFISIKNYENSEGVTFDSYIDGIDRKFRTSIKNEEEEVIYDYIVSNTNEFISWVNQLKTYSLEDYVNVNRVSPNYSLRDVVYYVMRPATLDGRIFNDMWDILTPEQKLEYLTKNVENQNLVYKGTIVGMKVGLSDYDNTIYYTIHNFNTDREETVEEKHIFESAEDAIKYLVEDSIAKNKKD